MVRCENVGLRYGTEPEVLSGLSFELDEGSFTFITGPSGVGKSSLLKLIYLALRPTRGRIEIFGRDTATISRRDMPYLRRRIGVVFQDFRLIDHLSVYDNVALPLRIAGGRTRAIRDHVIELLHWVGLGEHVTAFPHSLSGGQMQRVAIARAVIAKPSLLLADEPTGNVDDTIGTKLLRLFDGLNRSGTTVVVATHNAGLIGRFQHRVIRLDLGLGRGQPDVDAPADAPGLDAKDGD